MKPKPHFLPKRQTVIYGFTEQMLRDTGTNRRSFAMVVADQYLSMYALDDREVPFRITLGGEGDGDADKKHNGQILGRYLDGVVKTLPADLEDAWVMSLPEPYRSNCERELCRRRGVLPIRLDALEASAQTVGIGQMMSDFGDLVSAMTPAMADGVIDEKDRPYVRRIVKETDDMVIGLLTFRKSVVAACPELQA
ncbi:hypothetical protein [Stenotrophomonas lactitubi]|uniref:hypothetical protein n=1 Tax=Stenotrophomonas lactitubi TaxID=2045214 RepID=UPI0013101C7C|nr:hypothetical protein [Stenotrophomonas lactitubi]CAH0174988.1 hypothetical protein SRABI81_01317 [Stenotrophomonas lactitubi]CAH0175245.1 hypothetical protein SRABI122_01285 [Stenotrophomonas lactitubi]CAH0193444.1 hypothetical protein SRABI102_01574 [Stenotrophomonas lactitubi]CAH0227945.1 hypothetical protein SRABI66_02613 [Stenotrophomonas lactitubi]